MATNVDDAFGGYFRYWVYFSDLPSPSSDAGVLADFYFVGLLIYYSKKVSWDLLDVVLIGGAVLFIGGVMVHFWLTSKDALLASLNTLYPGKRVSTGGKWTIGEFFSFLTNWKIPFEDINYSNNSEVALFYHFFPTVFLASPFVLFGKKIANKSYWDVF